MAGVPGSVLQFLSVAVPLLANFVMFLFLAACAVVGKPKVLAPLKPESRVGQAKSVFEFVRAVRSLGDEDVRDGGGLEALLQVKRLQMRARMAFMWVLIGVAVAVVFALNTTGGATEGGFDRVTFQNANIIKRNESSRTGSSWWRNIAAVVGAYLVSFTLKAVDKADEEACELMLEEVTKAPAHHYAVVLTGVEACDLRTIFDSALGEGAVVRVETVKNYSTKPKDVVDEEESSSVLAAATGGGPGGLRERHAAYLSALRAAKRADLLEEGGSKKIPKMTKSVAETQREAHETLDKKRRAIERVADKELPPTAAAIVVLNSLAKATAASTAPLGIKHAWVVEPAPEPRDVLWPVLEKLPASQTDIDAREGVGSRLKLAIYLLWSLILLGLVFVAQFVLKLADKQLGGGAKTIVQLVSGMVPALVASIMMSLVCTILGVINAKTQNDCWNQSSLERKTQADFVLFLQLIGFVVPLLGASLITGATEMGGRPLRIFTIIATNVPFSAYYFAMLAFVKMAVFLNASTRFVPYVVYRVLSTLMCKTDFEKNQLLKPPPAKIAQWVGWESFVFLVGAVYAPLAPYATGIAWVYLSLATSALKLNLATVSKMPFETAGKSWRLGISQSINIVMVAHCLQIGVLLFSGNFIHFVLTLPVVLVDVYYAQKCGHRYENKNIHGKAKGRLPLLEASDVDKSRPPSYIHEIDKVFEADAFYAPSCALNNDVLAPFQDQENLELREISLFDWLARYDSPSKLPPQSQHSSEKSAEESKKEKAIQMA